MSGEILSALAVGLFIIVLLVIFIISRYRTCPSDKILVVYGRTSGNESAKCYAGGAAWIVPVIQNYAYLELTPLSIDVNLQDALSKQNIRVSVPAQFTVGIGREPELMQSAAERLLNLNRNEITNLSHDIIMGQMRLVIANMDIEELNTDRDKFVHSVYSNVGDELNKIGLKLINVNVTDIQDESGYIVALGQEAAAKAINEAKIKVAKEVRLGSIGQAEEQQLQTVKVAEAMTKAEIGQARANQEQRIRVAEANTQAEIGEAEASREQRIRVAEANTLAEVGEAQYFAQATEGKNSANIQVATSDAERDIEIAEANRRAIAAKKVAEAKALEEAYHAEGNAEKARAIRDEARMSADEIVRENIEKQKAIIAAQAEAERLREIAKGQADALLANYVAQAKGTEELLTKQAEGFEKLVHAAGGDPSSAIGYLMIDKLAELATIQVDAIRDLEIDKVVVYDNGNGQSVGNFVQGLYGMMPQLNDFLQQSGMNLPDVLVKKLESSLPTSESNETEIDEEA